MNPDVFTDAAVEEVDCTLSDGTETTCFAITTDSVPADHTTGPWCPTQVTDGPEAGGLWPDGGVAHDATGSFLENLGTFYNDDNWSIHNPDGSINYTETQAECEGAARPDDLDECRGHTDDDRGYHYHVTGPGENMILGCWTGLTVEQDDGTPGPPGGPSPN